MDIAFEKILYGIYGIILANIIYHCILYKEILVIETAIEKSICPNKCL